MCYWARSCKPFKEPKKRCPAWRAGTATLPGLLKRLQIRALGSLKVLKYCLRLTPRPANPCWVSSSTLLSPWTPYPVQQSGSKYIIYLINSLDSFPSIFQTKHFRKSHVFKAPASSSRIHRFLTGEKSQLRHVVIPARQATWLAGRYDNPMLT
jgi:hypothetical protein